MIMKHWVLFSCISCSGLLSQDLFNKLVWVHSAISISFQIIIQTIRLLISVYQYNRDRMANVNMKWNSWCWWWRWRRSLWQPNSGYEKNCYRKAINPKPDIQVHCAPSNALMAESKVALGLMKVSISRLPVGCVAIRDYNSWKSCLFLKDRLKLPCVR